MIADSSALVAIVLVEDAADGLAEKLTSAPSIKVSAVSLMETSMILLTRGGTLKLRILDGLILELAAEIIPVDRTTARNALVAFSLYGKGRHKAALNFGDCFVYALAKQTGEPLLFIGDDFNHTDLLLA